MATEVNKSGMDFILRAVLSVARQEQSLFYSPKIYSEHRNIIESLLLSALVKEYPLNQSVIDQISPFVEIATITNTNGFIQLPDGKDGKPAYRNLLGSPMIFANPESNGECGADNEPLTPQTFKTRILKSGCSLNPIVIVPQSEFAYRTTSTYDPPTWEDPIGYFVGNNQIRVCPFNVTKVAVMFARKEKEVRYGYIMQPDDTYLYDPSTTIETGFNSNSYQNILNASIALYSAYARNPDMQNWAQVLKNGIL